MLSSEYYQLLVEGNLLYFYGGWQLVVCLFAFLALMAIWWHIGRKQGDFGQVWLALSVLCWSFSGGVDVWYAQELQSQAQELMGGNDIQVQQEKISFQLQAWRSVMSLFNSLFILLALPWFKYIPKRIEPIVKSNYWHFIIGLPFLFSLMPTISRMFLGSSYGLISELDVYYSVLTLAFLGLILWESFARRRLLMLAWLSVMCILITFAAQLYKLTSSNIDPNLFSAIFKTSLIMIFFALALSWVKELAENIIPAPEQLFITLGSKKISNKKVEHQVRFRGIPGKGTIPITLTPALYELLFKFAKTKKEVGEDWLEIKPKNEERAAKFYDINDHNEIKRLLAALLDGIFGKGSWTKNLHEQPLKESLFEMSEKRDRKIRLRLPGENIHLV
ncbi:MAG: hypothetical protein AAFO07_10920 [Bacteroidota bacterium]